jgi:hypothetical protein
MSCASLVPEPARRRIKRLHPDPRGVGQLDAMMSSADWVRHMTRAALHLDHAGEIRGVTGDMIMESMNLWTSLIPS